MHGMPARKLGANFSSSAPDREIERVDVHRDAAARHQHVACRRSGPSCRAASPGLRAPGCPTAARCCRCGVGEQRAGAALDVDPAVGAGRAGVVRDRVELFLALDQVRGQRLQARGALLEIERQQRRHAGAARVGRAASPKSIVSACVWWISAPLIALCSGTRRFARRPSGRRSGFAGWRHSSPDLRVAGQGKRAPLAPAPPQAAERRQALQGWYFQVPFSIFTITRARWSRPRWSVGDMLKMPCAPARPCALSSASRSAARNSGVPGLAFFSAWRRGHLHQHAGVPGVARRRSRPSPCRTSPRTSSRSRARLAHRVVGRQLARDQHRARGSNVPSTSLPPTRRKSLLATPWVW